MNDNDFREIFRAHKDAVFGFAWRMTGSETDAEDIAQDVFLALLRAPGRFDAARGSIRPFLLGIARNLVLKRWRDEARWDVLEDEYFIALPLQNASGDIADAVGAAIAGLPPLQREALILSEYEEFSLAAIAKAVGAEVGTVKARLYRARENLRRMLAPLRGTVERRKAQHGTA